MLQLLDNFFLVFHSALIIFNLSGWIWKKTRRINLLTLSLTGFSWVILGMRYGIGYCPLTDWHWKVLKKLGETDLPPSYIHYLIQRITGIDLSGRTADYLTGVSFTVAFILSVWLNIKDRRK